jgi:hypothetical protein
MVDASPHGQCALADASFRHGIAQPAAEVAVSDAARKNQVVHESFPTGVVEHPWFRARAARAEELNRFPESGVVAPVDT